jgi:hypothetical protein
MSKEEKKDASADTVEELIEHRENKNSASHNVPVNAFQDARATLNTLQGEVCTHSIANSLSYV